MGSDVPPSPIHIHCSCFLCPHFHQHQASTLHPLMRKLVRCHIHQWPLLRGCLGYGFLLFTITYHVLAGRDDECSQAFLSSWWMHSQRCPKYLALDCSISKETMPCLVSEVKGKTILLVKYHPIKYEQWQLSWACPVVIRFTLLLLLWMAFPNVGSHPSLLLKTFVCCLPILRPSFQFFRNLIKRVHTLSVLFPICPPV